MVESFHSIRLQTMPQSNSCSTPQGFVLVKDKEACGFKINAKAPKWND